MILGRTSSANCGRSAPGSSATAPAAVLIGLVFAATTAIAGRAAIVSIAPATAAIYAGVGLPVNLHGLSIANVHLTAPRETDAASELVVTGEIENLRDVQASVPRLRLTLRGDGGRELYVWTARAPRLSLHAHERIPFRAALAAPPGGVRDILVKFAAPGDNGFFTEAPS
jgi:hypothetical protein